ncbi:MAG: hypothetical protein FWF16_07300, partial [Microbacteriaceae bacterium]|nr:hypothetical protein [Microbacteriaceae bacterium]
PAVTRIRFTGRCLRFFRAYKIAKFAILYMSKNEKLSAEQLLERGLHSAWRPQSTSGWDASPAGRLSEASGVCRPLVD